MPTRPRRGRRERGGHLRGRVLRGAGLVRRHLGEPRAPPHPRGARHHPAGAAPPRREEAPHGNRRKVRDRAKGGAGEGRGGEPLHQARGEERGARRHRPVRLPLRAPRAQGGGHRRRFGFRLWLELARANPRPRGGPRGPQLQASADAQHGARRGDRQGPRPRQLRPAERVCGPRGPLQGQPRVGPALRGAHHAVPAARR
mmetsp:Transcript_10223/g.30196  ORF Transcript_10223/g.30196 Transcript_10223/m.30196 type:complete len:200 (+) Transcript_10223:1561-2160(+)